MADDEADRVKPWTIKGITPDIRNAAISAADREKKAIGEWVGRAILAQVQADRNRTRAPAVVGPTVRPEVDLGEVERIIAAASALAGAAGRPPPQVVIRAAYGLLRTRLGEIKGPTRTLAGRTTKETGKTAGGVGQTVEPSGHTDGAEGKTE